MANKKRENILDTSWFRVVLMVVGAILTTAVLVFSVFTFVKAKNNQLEEAPKYMVWVFIFLGLSRFVSYLKDRKATSLIRALVLLIIDVGLGVMIIFAKYNTYIFSLSAGLFALSIILSRIFKLIEKHSVRDIVFSVLVIVFSIAVAIGFFQKVNRDFLGSVILLECLFIAVCTFIEASLLSLSQLKLDVFAKIIFKTFALEILFGLLALMATFSIILMYEEPTMSYYPDALWYCFTVVTTIGFGDFYATTLIGRLVTVVLGIYGIVVVAVFTSIIVNFYNETSGKKDAKEIREISQEHKK
jgi:hypothetical protein